MRPFFQYIILLVLMSSCSKKGEFQGLWFIESVTDKNGNFLDEPFDKAFISFTPDSVIELGKLSSRNFDINRALFSLTDSTLVINEYPYHYQLMGDSLILLPLEAPTERIQLKRINPDVSNNRIEINHFTGLLNLENSSGELLRKFNFMPDSTLQVESGLYCSGHQFGKWSLFQLDGFTFLNTKGVLPLSMIVSTSVDTIELRFPIDDDEYYYLTPGENPDKEKKLLGEWVENSSNGTVASLSGDSTKSAYFLSISEDSLTLEPGGTKKPWNLDLDGEYIFFRDHSYHLGWSLLKYNQDSLTIGIYDTIRNEVDTVYFSRKE